LGVYFSHLSFFRPFYSCVCLSLSPHSKHVTRLVTSSFCPPSSRQRERETKQRRAARATSRGIGAGSGADVERAFLLGLVDACPRCGESLEGYPDEAEQRRHLMECTDTRKHAAHSKAVGKQQAKAAAKEAKRDAQDSAQVRCSATGQRWVQSCMDCSSLQQIRLISD
jgi:hypothetical protein